MYYFKCSVLEKISFPRLRSKRKLLNTTDKIHSFMFQTELFRQSLTIVGPVVGQNKGGPLTLSAKKVVPPYSFKNYLTR
jgi:hypothetical protein